MTIKRAAADDVNDLAKLSCMLWPGHTAGEMAEEFAELLERDDAAVYLAVEDAAVGFAQCQLRRDYVEGTESSPVGYLEGIYVMEPHRGKGVAKELLSACQKWAKDRGCSEFASDCELDNVQSFAFHLKMGFVEANRIICFTKRI